jgi:hypothetical protein
VNFLIPRGSYSSGFKIIKCIFHGFGGSMNEVTVNGRGLPLLTEENRLPDGLRYLRDLYDPGYYANLRNAEKRGKQLTVSFPNDIDEINVAWK